MLGCKVNRLSQEKGEAIQNKAFLTVILTAVETTIQPIEYALNHEGSKLCTHRSLYETPPRKRPPEEEFSA